MGLLCVFPIAAMLAVVFKKKVDETIPATYLLMAGLLYAIALLFDMNTAVSIVLAVGVVSTFFCLVALIIKKACVTQFLTFGFLAFASYLVFFAIFSMGRGYFDHDDLNYWGLLVKDLYYDGNLNGEWIRSYMIHPPIAPIFNCFATRTWISYSESMSFLAQNSFCIAMFIPFFGRIKGKNKAIKFVCMWMAFLLIPLWLNTSAYNYLNVDVLFGFIMAYGLYVFLCGLEKKTDYYYWLFSALAFGETALLKRIAPVIITIIMLLIVFMIRRCFKKEKTGVIVISIIAGVVELSLFSWYGFFVYEATIVLAIIAGGVLEFLYDYYDHSNGRRKEIIKSVFLASALVTIMVVVLGIMMSGEHPVSVAIELFDKVFGMDAPIINSIVNISYFTFLIINLLTGYLYFKNRNYLTNEIGVFCLLLSTSALYILVLMYIYIGILSKHSNVGVPSYDRYILPFVVLLVFFWLKVVLDNHVNDNTKVIVGICLTIIVIGNPAALPRFMGNNWKGIPFYGFEKAGIELSRADKVYLIDETTEYLYMDAAFKYAIYPADCNMGEGLLRPVLKNSGYQYPSIEELSIKLSNNYDYVYIQTIDDNFIDIYEKLFERRDDIITGRVYKVQVIGEGKIKLVLQEEK